MSIDIHIDTINGSDFETGSRVYPVATFAKAKLLIGSAPLSTICMLNAPEYSPIIFPGISHAFVQGETLITGDTQWWAQGATLTLIGGWQDLGNGVYSQPLASNVFLALLEDTLDADGFKYCFKPRKTGTAAKTPNQGECGWYAGIFYIHLVGNADPNGRAIRVGQQSYSLFAKGNSRITVEKGHFRYGNGTLANANEDGWLTLNHCSFEYAGVTCVGGSQSLVSTTKIVANDCLAALAVTNDGWSIGGGASMDLNNCESLCVFEEGCTAHGNSHLNVKDGHYSKSGEGGMTSVDNAIVNLEGILFDHNWRNGTTPTNGGIKGGITADANSQVSVKRCVVRDHPGAGLWKSPTATLTIEETQSQGLNALVDYV